MFTLELTPARAPLPEGWSAAELDAAVQSGAQLWMDAAAQCTAIRILVKAPSAKLLDQDGVSVIGFRTRDWCHQGVCEGLSVFPPRAMAMTTRYPNSAEGISTRETDIELNAVHFAFQHSRPATLLLDTDVPPSPTPALETGTPVGDKLAVPLDAVLVHELGHALGLADLCPEYVVLGLGTPPSECPWADSVSVMFAPGLNRTPSAWDVERLCALHPRMGNGVAAPAYAMQPAYYVARADNESRCSSLLVPLASFGVCALLAVLCSWYFRRAVRLRA